MQGLCSYRLKIKVLKIHYMYFYMYNWEVSTDFTPVHTGVICHSHEYYSFTCKVMMKGKYCTTCNIQRVQCNRSICLCACFALYVHSHKTLTIQQGKPCYLIIPCTVQKKCQAGSRSLPYTSTRFPQLNPVNACWGFTRNQLLEASLVVSSEFSESV